ncbi:MAG: cupin domain-containing protein [Segniliparus sp.]|uniref:cupin domain-containing protein n=1 Tax=Segniliparus sp. TaxID=2804064 RepID=UPI003F3ED527
MALELFAENTVPLVRSADQEKLSAAREGNQIGLILDSEATNGLLGALAIRLAAGGHGAPPHIHRHSGELFHVVSGQAELLCGEKIHTLSEGDTAFVPPNTVHAFAAAPDSPAHLFTVLAPGTQRFDYFRLLDRIARGEAAPDQLVAAQERYDNHFVESPVWAGHRGEAAQRELRAPGPARARL